MGRQIQIPLASSEVEKSVTGIESLTNIYPVKSGGGKYQFSLVNSPGMAPFITLPITSPIKALHLWDSRAFAVTSKKLYEIFSDGTHKELGELTASGHVVTANNTHQLVIVDGLRGFAYDDNTKKITELAGDGWYPARGVTQQDGYFIFDRKGTGQFFISDLLDVTFDPLNFSTAEGQPDNLVMPISDHRELILFGTKTTEVWYNSGNADFPFERNQGAFIERGCASPYSVKKLNNSVFFVGDDLRVYQLAGYVPQPISNKAIEQSLMNVDVSDVFAYTLHDEGSLFYVLTIPASRITWKYDITLGTWHQIKDYSFEMSRVISSIFFGNKTLVGDFQSGNVFILTRDYLKDDRNPIVREFVLPTISNGRSFMSIYGVELDISAGAGLNSGQGVDPLAWMQYSKDGGKTWSNWKEAKLGKMGEYLNRVRWNRLGTARQFIIKVRISDPVKIDIGGAYINV